MIPAGNQNNSLINKGKKDAKMELTHLTGNSV